MCFSWAGESEETPIRGFRLKNFSPQVLGSSHTHLPSLEGELGIPDKVCTEKPGNWPGGCATDSSRGSRAPGTVRQSQSAWRLGLTAHLQQGRPGVVRDRG